MLYMEFQTFLQDLLNKFPSGFDPLKQNIFENKGIVYDIFLNKELNRRELNSLLYTLIYCRAQELGLNMTHKVMKRYYVKITPKDFSSANNFLVRNGLLSSKNTSTPTKFKNS